MSGDASRPRASSDTPNGANVCLCLNAGPVEYRSVEPRCPRHGEQAAREIASVRIARARADRNRQLSHAKIIGRASGRLLHEIRVNDRRGNFKECIGLYEPSECPICAEREGEDSRAR